MDQRMALLITAAALGSLIVLASPALSQVVIEGNGVTGDTKPSVEYGPVPMEGSGSNSAPKEAPPPPPSGCPYRNQKLDLIV